MVPAIVLAAGKSTRMGRSKALLPIGSRDTFITRIVRTFAEAGVEDVLVVLGHDAEAIAARLAESDVVARILVNPQYETGQWSSLVAGLNAIDRPGVSAALITLVDVPIVDASTIRAVVERFRRTGAPVVRPVRGSDHGHPVLVSRRLFDLIRRADASQGAKPVIRAHASAIGDVPVEDAGAFVDVDTPADYERVKRLAEGAGER